MTRMIRPLALAAFAALAGTAPVSATPPPPPAPHWWVKTAWECPGQRRSFIEIEQIAEGETGYRTKVVGLVIAGRTIDPASVVGLAELAARRNNLRIAGGFCDRGGESFGIEELASGRKASESGWRNFRVPYARTKD